MAAIATVFDAAQRSTVNHDKGLQTLKNLMNSMSEKAFLEALLENVRPQGVRSR